MAAAWVQTSMSLPHQDLMRRIKRQRILLKPYLHPYWKLSLFLSLQILTTRFPEQPDTADSRPSRTFQRDSDDVPDDGDDTPGHDSDDLYDDSDSDPDNDSDDDLSDDSDNDSDDDSDDDSGDDLSGN